MKILPELDILTAIVCDDIRREWNGKDILIGVYGSGIKFDSIPNFLVCSLWLEMNVAEAGTYEFYVRVSDGNGQVVFQPPTPAKITVPEAGFANIPMPGIGLNVASTGKLDFQLSATNQDWQTVRTLDVKVGPIPPLGF